MAEYLGVAQVAETTNDAVSVNGLVLAEYDAPGAAGISTLNGKYLVAA